ncbi:MAG: hypothetical protein JRH18_04610 [Deltaproteobacteria bacterium]|nr:hypothetical protein [Deltaproteobacteria bacterium]MBW1994845.1 hypothetical protein [Deltaproteobacteria bacterium]MBW2150926.1 hypothetical protein [Deltaproteobacteria bacterium]
MEGLKIHISKSARRFFDENGIEDVTFKLVEITVSGCCVGIAKEIETVYEAPKNASGYRYFQAEGRHIFISRNIKIHHPLTLTTEGIFKKRLCLSGATVPI